jgi:hypothetical protein
MNYPLKNSDIYKLLGNKTIVLRYHELGLLYRIEDLLSHYGNAVILYETPDDTGHWTAVFYTWNDQGRPVIEFFDPYGYSVDKEFSWTNLQQPRYLSKLLHKTKIPVEYNEHQLQRFANNIATCGRHVVNRIRYAGLPLSQYSRIFGGPESDRKVYEMTKQV